MSELYLLHFERPYWMKCQHYVGITKYTAEDRCAVHRGNRQGRPSKLVQYALRNGIDFVISHVERFNTDSEARQRELRVKRNGHFSKLCPICQNTIKEFKELPKVEVKHGIMYQDRVL